MKNTTLAKEMAVARGRSHCKALVDMHCRSAVAKSHSRSEDCTEENGSLHHVSYITFHSSMMTKLHTSQLLTSCRSGGRRDFGILESAEFGTSLGSFGCDTVGDRSYRIR